MFTNLGPLNSYDPLAILRLLYRIIFGDGGQTGGTDWVSKTHDSIVSFFTSLPFVLINAFANYVVFSFFLSIALLILLLVYKSRKEQIAEKIQSTVKPPEEIITENIKNEEMENPKWVLVESHINSDDANKWKLAILEADIILSELLDKLNLPGEGVGEKLKAVEESDFMSIEEAWEAHKIRNAIAHQGSDFLLTQREAKRVVKLYKKVFEEFKII